MSKRLACQLTNQPRGTQRYQPTQHEDEDRLTKAIITLEVYTQAVTSLKRAAQSKVVRMMLPNVGTAGMGEQAKSA
jgi:hypothetical protein